MHTCRVLIRPATEADLPIIQEIEQLADELFGQVGMPEIAEYEPRSFAELRGYLAAGTAWVADIDDSVAAFLLGERVEMYLHIEQVAVHPLAARQGIGRRLIDHTAGVARDEGLTALTLTTMADVPWNAPYYRRLGFVELREEQLTPGLRAIRKREANVGLDRWRRAVMKKPL